jgi:hypothetical protein
MQISIRLWGLLSTKLRFLRLHYIPYILFLPYMRMKLEGQMTHATIATASSKMPLCGIKFV